MTMEHFYNAIKPLYNEWANSPPSKRDREIYDEARKIALAFVGEKSGQLNAIVMRKNECDICGREMDHKMYLVNSSNPVCEECFNSYCIGEEDL